MIKSFLNSFGAKLFLASFLSLFLELSLIRYIPSQIRLVGYFSNLILLASFFGLGLGFLLSRRKSLLHFSPILLFLLIVVVGTFKLELNVTSPDVIFLRPEYSQTSQLTEPEILLPIIYLLTAFIFIPLGQLLGSLFLKFKPLTAYSIDIMGAIAGIGLFTFLSFLSTPAYVWFVVISLLYFYLLYESVNWKLIYAGIILILTIVYVFSLNRSVIWSPYYRISIFRENLIYKVAVNNLMHQDMVPVQNRPALYHAHYDQFKGSTFDNILIIGAGSGSDIAMALSRNPNLKSIDAVEIDPKLYEIGKNLNPDRPYDDPRVNVVIDDGKNFLLNSQKKYDLIIFAFTDSLVAAASSGNLRLESFLFTVDTFKLAKDHLSDNGLVVLYNYYAQDWLIDKLSIMMGNAFGNTPLVYSLGHGTQAAVIINGPKIKDIETDSIFKPYTPNQKLEPASDIWPFLYLKERGVPTFYLKFISIIGVLSLFITFGVLRRSKKIEFDTNLFFLGAGFMLLETKSLVTFSLLFGTTWLVNSLVIMAILTFILVANLISQKYEISSKILYASLFGLLTLNVFVSSASFLGLAVVWRYVYASLFYLSPIFIANLIFSQKFKDTKYSDASFASNMLGALFGGLVEYMALATGYQSLIFVVIIFYGLSFIRLKPSQ